MPSVNAVARTLNEVNAILAPILLVADVFSGKCTGGKSSSLAAVNKVKAGVVAGANSGIADAQSAFQEFTETTSEGYLNLSGLNDAVTSATPIVKQVTSQLDSDFQSLQKAKSTLDAQLADQCQFTIGGKPVTNQFLTTADVTTLQALLGTTETSTTSTTSKSKKDDKHKRRFL